MRAISGDESTHRVTVLPSGIEFTADDGESVFLAARREGLEWPTRCLGRGSCRQCYFQVEGAGGEFSEVARLERDALTRVAAVPVRGMTVRLACQAKVLDDVVVHRMEVRRGQEAASVTASPTQDQQEDS